MSTITEQDYTDHRGDQFASEVEPGVTRGDLKRELQREEALRHVCQFCEAELPGSNVTSTRVSHGACKPLCDEAKAMGWGE